MMPDEQEKPVVLGLRKIDGIGQDFEHRSVTQEGEALWIFDINEVGVTAGDRADPVGIGAGPEAGGRRRIAKSQGAGRQKGLGERFHRFIGSD